MKYGELPIKLNAFKIECKEMMFYQYLPIKFPHSIILYEERLFCFDKLIQSVFEDFKKEFGKYEFINSYIYLTVKCLYQPPKSSFNRMGWHADGFLTDDINYIWCDKYPTTFNSSEFKLTLDDAISMQEMEEQALLRNNITYKENQLLRLNQYNIHKVSDVTEGGMRTFVKISFSKDRYDLVGNSHNYELNYNWQMKERKIDRNIPQSNKI